MNKAMPYCGDAAAGAAQSKQLWFQWLPTCVFKSYRPRKGGAGSRSRKAPQAESGRWGREEKKNEAGLERVDTGAHNADDAHR